MKSFTILLIFSGLCALNRCSSDLKFSSPFDTQNKNNTEIISKSNKLFHLIEKSESDSLTSGLFIIHPDNFNSDSGKINKFYPET